MKQPREMRPSWFVHISKSPKKQKQHQNTPRFFPAKKSPRKQKQHQKNSEVFSQKKHHFSATMFFFLHPRFQPFQLWGFPEVFLRCRPSPEMDGRCKGPHHRRHNLNFCCPKTAAWKWRNEKLTAPGCYYTHTSPPKVLGVEKPWKWFGLSKFGFFRRFSLFQLIFRWSIWLKLQGRRAWIEGKTGKRKSSTETYLGSWDMWDFLQLVQFIIPNNQSAFLLDENLQVMNWLRDEINQEVFQKHLSWWGFHRHQHRRIRILNEAGHLGGFWSHLKIGCLPRIETIAFTSTPIPSSKWYTNWMPEI